MSRFLCGEVSGMTELDMALEYEEMEFIAADERRYIVLVIYDIVDNKRRSRMVKCVERYGIRVQKSAFEAFLSKKKDERAVWPQESHR